MEKITVRIRDGKIVGQIPKLDAETKLRTLLRADAGELKEKICDAFWRNREEEHVEQMADDGRGDPGFMAAL